MLKPDRSERKFTFLVQVDLKIRLVYNLLNFKVSSLFSLPLSKFNIESKLGVNKIGHVQRAMFYTTRKNFKMAGNKRIQNLQILEIYKSCLVATLTLVL